MTATLNPRTETAKQGDAGTHDTNERQELDRAANLDATPSSTDAGLAADDRAPVQAPLLIDVRSAAEFAAISVPGSVNIPLPLLEDNVAAIGAALAGPVELLCQSGPRAERARQVLAGAGFDAATVSPQNVAQLERGGGAIRAGRRWSLERQVRLAAGSLVLIGLGAGRTFSPKARVVSGVIGGGLTFAVLSNTCAMGAVLSHAPWNRGVAEPTLDGVLEQLARR